MTVDFEDKDFSLPKTDPRRKFRAGDANALKKASNANEYVPYGLTSNVNAYDVSFTPTYTGFTFQHGKFYHIKVGATSTSAISVNGKKVYKTDGVQAGAAHFIIGVHYLLAYDSSLDSGAGGFTVVNELQHGYMNMRGAYNASSNLYPNTGGSGPSSAIRHGDTWIISGAGTPSAGVDVNIGDLVTTAVDNPGQNASLWHVIPGRNSVILKSKVIESEVPSGTIDGVNDEFTLANTPESGTLKLYNAIRLKGGGVDYTLVGNVITFVTPPEVGSNLQADYRKQ